MDAVEDRPFLCEVFGCGKRFRRREHLLYHSCTHTGIKNFKCSHHECLSAFVTNAQLKRHLKVHENPNPYVCSVCNEAFSKKSKLREHRLQIHNIAEFLCTIDGCHMMFESQSKLERHQNTHSDRYVCLEPGCMQLMSNYFEFRRHRAFAHKVATGSSSSSSSGKNIKNEADANLEFDNNNDENYDVDEDDDDDDYFMQCQEVSSNRKRKAVNNTDTEILSNTLLSGSSSSAITSTSTITTTNTNTNTADTTSSPNKEVFATGSRRGSDVELFHCQFPNCLRKFTLMRNLRAHVRGAHCEEKDRRFPCPVVGCNLRFGFKQIMKRHVENIHVNGRVGRRPGTYGAYNKSGLPVETDAGLASYESQLDTNDLLYDYGMKDIRSFDYLSDPTVAYMKKADLNIFQHDDSN